MVGMIWGGIRGSYIRDRANVRHRDGDWRAPRTQHREHQLSHLYNNFVRADMAKSHNIVLFCIFICKLCQNSESESLNCDDLKVPFQVVSVAVFFMWWNGSVLSVMHCFRKARQGKARQVFPGNDPHPGLLLHLLLVRLHDIDVVHLKADTSNAANNAPRAQRRKRSQNLESMKGKIDTGKNNPWLH